MLKLKKTCTISKIYKTANKKGRKKRKKIKPQSTYEKHRIDKERKLIYSF